MITARAEKLRQIRLLNDTWVAENLASASEAFDSAARSESSDYNVHHVELDASGDAQDDFVAEAMAILASDVATRSTFGQVAVTSDPWLRNLANSYLRGLPPLPDPLDVLRDLADDDKEAILLEALRELASRQVRAWNPAQHKRWPKGHPLAGKFRPMVELLKEAVAKYDGNGRPFQHFSREQLMKGAKALGIALKRGEDKESISDKILAELVPMAAPGNKVAPKKPPLVVPLDDLDAMDDRDLRDLALEYGIKVDRRRRASIVADIRKARAVEAAEAAKAARKPVVPPAAAPAVPPPAAVRPEVAGYHENVADVVDLKHTVETRVIRKETHFAAGAIGDTRLREYDNGQKVVWKGAGTRTENDAEQLSSLIARVFGLQAPRIYRNAPREVNMDYVANAKMAVEVPGQGIMDVSPKIFNTKEARMMGLLDQLIKNTDRHNGNWLIRDDGHIVPIDHGFAFTGRQGVKLGDGSVAAYVRSPFAKRYAKDTRRDWLKTGVRDPKVPNFHWIDHDLTKSDIRELRQRLQRIKPEFDRLGRTDWHDFMIARLDAIGKHAKGTTSQLLPALV